MTPPPRTTKVKRRLVKVKLPFSDLDSSYNQNEQKPYFEIIITICNSKQQFIYSFIKVTYIFSLFRNKSLLTHIHTIFNPLSPGGTYMVQSATKAVSPLLPFCDTLPWPQKKILTLHSFLYF